MGETLVSNLPEGYLDQTSKVGLVNLVRGLIESPSEEIKELRAKRVPYLQFVSDQENSNKGRLVINLPRKLHGSGILADNEWFLVVPAEVEEDYRSLLVKGVESGGRVKVARKGESVTLADWGRTPVIPIGLLRTAAAVIPEGDNPNNWQVVRLKVDQLPSTIMCLPEDQNLLRY